MTCTIIIYKDAGLGEGTLNSTAVVNYSISIQLLVGITRLKCLHVTTRAVNELYNTFCTVVGVLIKGAVTNVHHISQCLLCGHGIWQLQ